MLERIFKHTIQNNNPIILPEETKKIDYNSVLDFLVGLSKSDYNKMIKSADIYREANQKVSKVVGVVVEPTASIFPKNKDGEYAVDEELDQILNTPEDELSTFLEDNSSIEGKQ